MVKRLAVLCLISALLCGIMVNAVETGEGEEHRLLGDSVYHPIMRLCATPLADAAYRIGNGPGSLIVPDTLHNGLSFGQLCSLSAADDLARDRFHERGRTVLHQLSRLTAERIAAVWQIVSVDATDTICYRIASGRNSSQNVLSSYLLHHLMALRLAGRTADGVLSEQQGLLRALSWEAAAQGFLVDAFSSGHLLVDQQDPWWRWQRRNRIEAHHYHRDQGVYVINSRGDVWRTYGDRLMHWHAPAYRAVVQAGRSSLQEVLAVFFLMSGFGLPEQLSSWLDSMALEILPQQWVSSWLFQRAGADYYATLRLPTLLLLPMPVSATWSVRTQERDEYGVRRHHHFPQLSDPGLHDPDLSGIDTEFLYPRSAVPEWMIPVPLRGDLPRPVDSLIKNDPDWASVRWVQNRYALPSYKGALVHLGGQVTSVNGAWRSGALLGLGYGFWDDLIVVKNVSVSAVLQNSAIEWGKLLLVPSVGGGLATGSGRIKALRFETGLAIDLSSDGHGIGSMAAIGIDSRVYALRFTNAGISWRLKYQWFNLKGLRHGPCLELLLH
ncbi:MAG: hypothetical protein ABII79_10150 [bacterium]